MPLLRFLRYSIFSAVAVLPAVAPASGQALRWTAHTSMREAVALASGGGALWAATPGGVYRYDPASGEVLRFTAGEGLHAAAARAIAFDPRCGEEGCVWVGYQNGVLDWIDVAAREIRSYRDIERATRFPNREIHRLVMQGDSVLVATAFGLVVFDRVRREVRDTYSRLGGLPAATPVYDVVVDRGVFHLATLQGVASAPVQGLNLTDPASWTVTTEGLPNLQVNSIEAFGGSLYAGAQGGLAVRSGAGAFTPLIGGTVTDLFTGPNRLYGIDGSGLIVVEGGSARRITAAGYEALLDVVVGPGGALWLADRAEGLALAVPEASSFRVERTFYPEGPYHNDFTEPVVDRQGTLWVGGSTQAGAGFYSRDPSGAWTDYTARQFAALRSRSGFSRLYADPKGGLWAGSEGAALAHVTPEGQVEVFDYTNSSLRNAEGAAGNPGFILIGGIAADRDGNTWVTNRAAAQALHVRTPSGQWAGFPVLACDGLTPASGSYDRLFIDSFDQKWITVVDTRNLRNTIGLVVLDTGDSPTNPSDDVCRFFGTSGARGQGLPSIQVNAVTEDRDGLIWIATDDGPAYLLNTGIVARDPQAFFTWPVNADRNAGSSFLLNRVIANDIEIDPANRIWLATEQGVWLIEQAEGGYRSVANYTVENSPLFSNTVRYVAVDPLSGEVYFSTDLGLISLSGASVAPAEKAGDLFVYPNPALWTAGSAPVVTIEGLVDATDLMIVAPNGEVVTRFETRGGRATWDGRTADGRDTPSGVYIVVAVGKDGEGTAYGKVAVIR